MVDIDYIVKKRKKKEKKEKAHMRTPSLSDIELGPAGTYAVLEGFSP